MAPRHRTRRLQRGLTLLELLVVLVITVILMSAVSYAMMAEVSFQSRYEQRRTQQSRMDNTEREITRLIQGIKFAPATTTGTTGTTGGGGAAATTAATSTTVTPTSVGTTTYFQGLNDGGQALTGSDRLTFTTTEPGVPQSVVYSQDDYQTQQNEQGPVGGVSEVSIGLQPVGTPTPGNSSGLFERVQTPSDTDPTQGGNEWVLDPNIDQIGFQFWDGQEWQPTWDTTTDETTTLPEAVQVTYTLRDEPGSPQHLFVVTIPASTVTAQNPYTGSTTTTSTATTTGGATP